MEWIGTNAWLEIGEVKRGRCRKLEKPALGVISEELTKEKLKSPWIPMELWGTS